MILDHRGPTFDDVFEGDAPPVGEAVKLSEDRLLRRLGAHYADYIADGQPGRWRRVSEWAAADLFAEFNSVAGEMYRFPRRYDPRPPTQIEAELARLGELGLPLIADGLRKLLKVPSRAADPSQLFEPGEVLLEEIAFQRLSQHVRCWLDRHVRGDAGLEGDARSVGQVSELARFCPSRGSPIERNKLAIDAAAGVVMSRYAGDPPAEAEAAPQSGIIHSNGPTPRRGRPTGLIMTALRPGQPSQTLVLYTGHLD